VRISHSTRNPVHVFERTILFWGGVLAPLEIHLIDVPIDRAMSGFAPLGGWGGRNDDFLLFLCLSF
jgi:hypothetical protein